MDMNAISQLELDLLLLFYTYSDQHGNVDVKHCQEFAKDKMGVYLPSTEFKLEQQHINVLMERGLIPDTRALMSSIPTTKPKIKRKRISKD